MRRRAPSRASGRARSLIPPALGAVLLLFAGGGLALVKADTAALAVSLPGAVLLVLVGVAGLQRQARWKRRHTGAFPERGRSGAPLSRQTHLPM